LTATAQYPLGWVAIYRDGIIRQTTSLEQFKTVPKNGTAPMRIGTRDGENFFQGAVAKLAVYDRLLTPDEITARITAMDLADP
jgi:hypothetical protein